MKVFGSWGRYFDWTKYELARGSFGGDIWHIYYRSLDTLDIGSLNLSNMPGRDLWGSADRLPRPPRDRLREHRSRHQADVPGQHQRRRRVPVEPDDSAQRPLRPQRPRPHHRGHGRARRRRQVYVIGNPGEGHRRDLRRRRTRRRRTSRCRSRSGSTTRSSSASSRRFSKNWFGSANYTLSRLYGNYSGLADSDEILTPTTGVSVGDGAAAGRQHRPRRAATPTALGHRRAAVGFARQPRRARPARRPIGRTS